MSTPSGNLLKAIVNRWVSAGLDKEFVNRAANGYTGFTPLCDTEAAPEQPFPYCVFEQGTTGNVLARMSGRNNQSLTNQRHHRVPVTFRVYAKSIGSKSAKDVANDLASHVMDAFGDDANGQHELTLEVGEHVDTQYQNDYPMREGDDEHSWVIVYDFIIDMPVAMAVGD